MSNTVAVSPVRVAVVQFDPQVGIHHQPKNLENSLHLAQEVVTNRANLIVLPELANTGYLFASRQMLICMPSPFLKVPALRHGSISRRTIRSIWWRGSRNGTACSCSIPPCYLGRTVLSANTAKLTYGIGKNSGSRRAILVFLCLKRLLAVSA